MKKPPHPPKSRNADISQALRQAVQFHQQGWLDRAEPLYAAILAAQPSGFEPNFLFGVLRIQQGRHREALDLIGAALKANPNSASAHFSLGTALEKAGRLEAALASFERALAIKPDYVQALYERGNALLALQRAEPALASFDRAIALKPDYAEAFYGRAMAQLALAGAEAALASFDQAIALAPDHAEAHNNRGNALLALKRPEAALASFDRAIATRPDYADALSNRAVALVRLKRPLDALSSYDRALALEPANLKVLDNKGALLIELGRIGEAKQVIEAAIKLAPRWTRPYYNLTLLERMKPDDPHLQPMEALARDIASFAPEEQIELNFALAKAYADNGDHEASFRRLAAGNALKRKAAAYDEAAALGLFERIREVFAGGLMRRLEGSGEASAAPVFILGMPRSGTTLVEQILASHPKVFGAGELEDFEGAVADLRRASGVASRFPEMFAAATDDDMRRLGAIYLQRIGAAESTAERITDKMPGNFLCAGLIHLALPNARIIHTRRDPMDTCFSCFSQPFFGKLAYTYDLGELGRYYVAYEALMAHWRDVMPEGVMLEVQYEDVVADLEGQARRMVAHCGLEWDERCLEFHRTERQVSTASVIQVRQPIYASSVGRWRAYEAFLGPLREALQGKSR